MKSNNGDKRSYDRFICTMGFRIQARWHLKKMAARIITYSKYNSHFEPLLKTLDLLSVTYIFKLNTLKLYFRYSYDNLPLYFKSMITQISDRLTRDTRQKSMLCELPTKTKSARHFIRHCIPELLNKTEPCITDKIHSHSCDSEGFSNYAKKRKWFMALKRIAI